MLTRQRAFFGISILCATLMIAGLVGATVVERKDSKDLVKSAEIIIEGKCLQKTVGYDKRGRIATTYSVEVGKALRAAKRGEIVKITFPGGELDGRGLIIPGVPALAVGEEFVIFLTEESPRGIRYPVGLAQGKFQIERDAKTGEKRLRRDLADLDIVDLKTGNRIDKLANQTFVYNEWMQQIEKLVADDDAQKKAAESLTKENQKKLEGTESRKAK
ncbi:MAG: hypothetical protein ACKVS6_16905 [Planctomycetota bacterium]